MFTRTLGIALDVGIRVKLHALLTRTLGIGNYIRRSGLNNWHALDCTLRRHSIQSKRLRALLTRALGTRSCICRPGYRNWHVFHRTMGVCVKVYALLARTVRIAQYIRQCGLNHWHTLNCTLRRSFIQCKRLGGVLA